jgi:error-prone DNA polymerase
MWSQSTKRQEARAWGVPFLPFDINRSGSHYRVERVPRDSIPAAADGDSQLAPRTARTPAAGSGSTGRPATDDCLVKSIRPPLSAVNGVSQDVAKHVLLERLRHGPYRDIDDAYQRLTLSRDTFEVLIRAGTFDGIQERRQALFRLGALATSREPGTPTLFTAVPAAPDLPPLTLPDRYVWDYQTTRFSTLEIHAIDLVRDQLREIDCVPLLRLRRTPRKTRVRTAGLVVGRQRPGTAKGFAFFVIEDGPTRAQVIISPTLWDDNRILLRDASMLVVDGIVEDTGYQLTLKAIELTDLPAPIRVTGYHFG